MNGNGGCASECPMDMYPLQQQVQPPMQLPTVSMMALPSSGGAIGGHTLSHPPVPISELAAHIDRLKMNNNALFAQVLVNNFHFFLIFYRTYSFISLVRMNL